MRHAAAEYPAAVTRQLFIHSLTLKAAAESAAAAAVTPACSHVDPNRTHHSCSRSLLMTLTEATEQPVLQLHAQCTRARLSSASCEGACKHSAFAGAAKDLATMEIQTCHHLLRDASGEQDSCCNDRRFGTTTSRRHAWRLNSCV
jgi:hypothetical protein